MGTDQRTRRYSDEHSDYVSVTFNGVTVNLTEHQIMIIKLVARGLSNREIGDELFVTEDTIKTHLRKMFRRTKARNRPHLVTWGFLSGVLKVPEADRSTPDDDAAR